MAESWSQWSQKDKQESLGKTHLNLTGSDIQDDYQLFFYHSLIARIMTSYLLNWEAMKEPIHIICN